MTLRGRTLIVLAVLAGLSLALWLRLDFLTAHHQVPVVWDAAGYNIQAREFAAAWKSPVGSPEFDRHFRKAYEMALPKCEIYPLLVSLVYHLHRSDFQAVRIVQGVMGTLSCLLLFLIARLVFNRAAAFLALLGMALYIPFFLSEGRLLTETVAIFILLGTTLLLLVSCRRGGWWWLVLSGLAVAVLMVTRTFFQYIFIVYVPLVFAALRARRIRLAWLKTLLFILAIAALIVPRYFWTGQVDPKGRNWLSGSWRNGMAIYTGIYPPNQGLQTDAAPGGEVLARVRASSPRGTPIDDIYFKAYVETLLSEPGRAVPVLLSKGWLFWKRAYNDFLQSYLLSPGGIDSLNRVWLLLGLFGLGLVIGRGPGGWLFLGTGLYVWALCFAADAESRYTLPAMPFMIAAGSWLVCRALAGMLPVWRAGPLERVKLMLGIVLIPAAAALAWLARPGRLVGELGVSFPGAFNAWIALALVLIFSPVPFLALTYRSFISGCRRWWAALVPPVILAAIFLSAVSVHRQWHEWRVRLDRPGETIRQSLAIPADLEKFRSASLKLDLLSGPVPIYDLAVKLDGVPVRIFQRGLTPDAGAYIASRRAFPVYLREEKRGFGQVRQWYSVPLDLEKLRGRDRIELELEFRPLSSDPGVYVDVFGDYFFDADPRTFDGPTFSQSPKELSLYRYLFFDDWRLWRRRVLEAEARAVDRPGRYRALLLLSRIPERRTDFPVAVKNERYLTNKSLVADYYNLQVWEMNPWKRRGDLMVIEAAHAAPGREGGFSLVAYADDDGDAKPDRLIASSPRLEGEKAGDWSTWTLQVKEKNVFLGMTWPKGSPTRVYYERALWPDEMFREVMYYRTGTNAPKADPVLTNLRVTFPPAPPVD